MKKLIINANRNGYSPDQCGQTMTVAELIAYLEQFDEEAQVFLSHDNGYTYGSITERDFIDECEDEEEDEPSIEIPVYSEEPGEDGSHEVVGYRREYV